MPHAQMSVALEAGTSSGAEPSSSAGPYHDNALDLGLDTTVNVMRSLGCHSSMTTLLSCPHSLHHHKDVAH
jgi:hypothetical protein